MTSCTGHSVITTSKMSEPAKHNFCLYQSFLSKLSFHLVSWDFCFCFVWTTAVTKVPCISLFLPCLICSVIVGCFIDMHFFILNTVFHHCCDFLILFKVLFTFHNLFQFDIYIQRTYIAYIDIYTVMVITKCNTTSIVYTGHKSNQSYMYG